MKIPAARWYQALKERSSRRQFYSKIIEKPKIKQLNDLIEKINNDFDDLRIILVQKNVEEIFTGVLGSYGKISGAPAYLAFVGREDTPYMEEKIGYGGEAVILEATALELGTCWVSGTFKAEAVLADLDLKETEKLYAISPLGYPEENPTISERILKTVISSKKRMDLDKLIINKKDLEEEPEWVKTALKTAHLAPSAVNRQPWRFKLGENSITIQLDTEEKNEERSKNLDCGIAMLHLEVGSLKAGVSGSWKYLEGKEVARFAVE
ncbi:putative nitroreductase [Halanaerobium saccharolyticum]|uniref:Putative nitroreductase n=1 Tax=Halanaerobium saccharolyticum TaxID=43595 RepID=A0A4R6LKY9_9FIRM|nr:nitroreductase family protein [Halanaerobium saccharolyticum]TDO85878.1 putative nitroreductase [Halanaerobium saccharolyticum]